MLKQRLPLYPREHIYETEQHQLCENKVDSEISHGFGIFQFQASRNRSSAHGPEVITYKPVNIIFGRFSNSTLIELMFSRDA